MSLELIIAIVVFFAVFGLAFVIVSLGSRNSARLQSRLSRHTLSTSAGNLVETGASDDVGQPFGQISTPFARTLGRLSLVRSARVTLFRANMRLGVGRYFLIRLLLAVVALAAVQIAVGGPFLPAGAALVAFTIPRIVIGKMAARRAAAFEGQLAETLDMLVGSLRAGQGLVQAIESASHEQPEPMSSELQRIVDQVNMGGNISEAMESLTTRFDSRDVDLLAAAVAINRETGGNLTEVLERLAKTVRQRRDVRAEAKSLTAAPRATGYILVVLPFLITGYSVAISPIYREQLLHAPVGRMILIGAIVWSLIGFTISQKLAKAEY